MSVRCFGALYMLRASPRKLAELCTVLDVAETPLWRVALVGRLWARSSVVKANRVLAGASVDARGHEPGSALPPISLAAAEMGSARPGLCRQKTGRAVGARGRRGRAGRRMNWQGPGTRPGNGCFRPSLGLLPNAVRRPPVADEGRDSRQRRACMKTSPAIASPAHLHYLSLGWAMAPPSPDGFDKCSCRALTITHFNPSVTSQAAAQTEGEGGLSARLQRC